MKKFPLSILAVVSSLILLNSCLNNTGTTQPQQGAFLVAQLSPDAPSVDVSINGSNFDTAMYFGNYTHYIGANPGTFNFKVFAPDSSTATTTSNVTIEANKYYSYFIIDSFNKVKSALVPDVFQAPSGDSVYVRFLNFCPNDSVPLNLIANGVTWASGRTFNDQANPQFFAFFEQPSGTYSFDLKTVTGNVLKTKSLTLTGGHVYTLFAKGIIGNADTTKALSVGILENYPQQ